MADTHLPQPVFFPHKDTSKDVLMMQQREHVGAEQNWVCPLSPILHIRRVPCHRRFSFPADRPVLTNWPWASTAALKRDGLISESFLFYDQGKKNCLFTYKCRNQLKMLQVLRSCTLAGQAGMWILRVSTRPWIVPPLLVKNQIFFIRAIQNKKTDRSWKWHGRMEPLESSGLYFQHHLHTVGYKSENLPFWALGDT